MRLDVARVLKRFHYCEQPLIVAQAGWISSIAPIEIKIALPHHFWQDALTADALRTRVFELRYPSRLLEVGNDAPVVSIFERAISAPNALAFISALASVYKPALLNAYQQYLDVADDIADGPSVRFLRMAVQDKQDQINELRTFTATLTKTATDDEKQLAVDWVNALQADMQHVGGLGLEAPTPARQQLSSDLGKPFSFAEVPARDARFQLVRFYWPNVVDPDFPYGDGLRLQLRSAVSHLNEVWAIETGGAILHAFADDLEWEFILDAARWTYDEARHTKMGLDRLTGWGYQPEELPLGTYIFDSALGEPPVIRLGMLHYFETKNIGKKNDRAEAFASYNDDVSRHDMEFDWADETIHAHYGAKWLRALHDKYPDMPDRDSIHARCDDLVNQIVASATDAERDEIRQIAEAMISKAEQVAQLSGVDSSLA
jgi:uncharacterized ferritin-like protein (DUF455 family)